MAGAARPVFLKIFLIVLLGMAAAMAVVRVVAYLSDFRGNTILARVMEARAALPRVVVEENPAIFFGSSMMEAAFSPRQFDREMGERGVRIRSFNFGFGGLNPYFQEPLAKRIREAFEAQGRRLELAVIEFNPFQATQVRWQRALPVLDSFLTVLTTQEELWEILVEDPARGLRMANIRYLRDNVSAEMITHRLGEPLRPGRVRSGVAKDLTAEERVRRLSERIAQLFEEEFPDHEGREWHYGWQGGGPIPDERSEETLAVFVEYYEALRTEGRLDDDRLRRIHNSDVEELRFEEELVAAFIRQVEVFQEFSDRVEVIMLPRNTDWVVYTTAAEARLRDVVKRIESEAGVSVQNYQELDIVPAEMFSDTTHLTRYAGAVAFTHFLVEQYVPGVEVASEGGGVGFAEGPRQ